MDNRHHISPEGMRLNKREVLNWMSACMTDVRATYSIVGLGSLGVTCSPRDPRFAGLNLAQVDEFFQDVKILSTSPPGGILSCDPESEISGSLKNLKPEKNRPLSKI